jgi:signal transduction histidine kinase
VLERACAAVADGFGFDRVGIVRYVPETSTLVPFAGFGLTSAETRSLPAALPVASFDAFRRALATSRAVFVNDPAREGALPEALVRGFGIGSFVIVPLVSEGRCLGFLTCDERGGTFTLDPSEVDLLTTFGTLIAAFLEKAIAQGELRRLNELKSQFAALASHELRTPVAAIYGVVRTLDEREDDLNPEQQQQLRRMLTQQTKRLLDLVENLLDLSRLEADSLHISPTAINIHDHLDALIDATADGEISLDAPADLTAIVDPDAFDRIVSNLLWNAVRHGAPPIDVSAFRDERELRVAIRDHGTGVAPEFVGSLFDRFTRGATDSSVGAGLGLSIALSFTRAHGGTLTYEPGEPTGSVFRLSLPLGTAPSPAERR